MTKRFFINILMGISLMYQTVDCLSPHQAAIATGITTVGIATGSYLLLSNYNSMSILERCGLTAVITAPLSYIASVLWFGFTPEMRYFFGKKAVELNDVHAYATQTYDSAEELLQDVELQYSSYSWLVDLHEDMVRSLSRTRLALKKWTFAQSEESITQYPYIESSTYNQLQKQRVCLEHNLLLLRRYRPFQNQHNAWISTHNCHYASY